MNQDCNNDISKENKTVAFTIKTVHIQKSVP